MLRMHDCASVHVPACNQLQTPAKHEMSNASAEAPNEAAGVHGMQELPAAAVTSMVPATMPTVLSLPLHTTAREAYHTIL